MSKQHALSEISIEITLQCLQNCVHCSSGASIYARESLSKEEIIKVAQDFKLLGGNKIELSGGEPLLHKDIGYILQTLKQMGLKINVFTCGSLSKESNYKDTMSKMVNLLKVNQVDKVVFSLHGSNARTHDDIVKSTGSFSHAIEFIRELVKEKVPVGIHFVPMSLNFEEFADLVDFALQLGIQDVSVLRFVPQGRGEKNSQSLMLNKMEVAGLVELLSEEEKRTDINVRVGSHLDFTFLLDGGAPKDCVAGVSKCLIEANGEIIPCAVFKGMTDKNKESYVAGNIKKDSLVDVWRKSEIFERFRKFDAKSLVGDCSICQHLPKCKGRCPAQRIYDHGDFYTGPDDYCPKEIYAK